MHPAPGRAQCRSASLLARAPTTSGGSGYYYLRHYKLNANTWFNNRDNAPKSDDVLHQPGGRIGGPIMIPGIFSGRNKAFFFFNYEESRSPGRTPRIGRCCTRAPNRAGSATRPAAQTAKSTCWRSRPRTACSRRWMRPSPAARRHPRLHGRQHGRRHHRPADPELHFTPTRPTASRSIRPAVRRQPDRQASAVLVDDLHGSGVDAGHDQQPRATTFLASPIPAARCPTATSRGARCDRRSAATS